MDVQHMHGHLVAPCTYDADVYNTVASCVCIRIPRIIKISRGSIAVHARAPNPLHRGAMLIVKRPWLFFCVHMLPYTRCTSCCGVWPRCPLQLHATTAHPLCPTCTGCTTNQGSPLTSARHTTTTQAAAAAVQQQRSSSWYAHTLLTLVRVRGMHVHMPLGHIVRHKP